jgi:hypothetical protein
LFVGFARPPVPVVLEPLTVLSDQGADELPVKPEDIDDVVQQAVNRFAIPFKRKNPVATFGQIRVAAAPMFSSRRYSFVVPDRCQSVSIMDGADVPPVLSSNLV